MIFNPLFSSRPSDPDQMVSESLALTNAVVGVCPKCGQQFGTALMGNETVYYCESCRVSHPVSE